MIAVAISVIIPTIGRPERLRALLASLEECEPAPAEVLVIDQSQSGEVAEVVGEFAALGPRAFACEGTGIARAVNLGLELSAHESVAITHDDCTVAPDWIGVASGLASSDPGAIFTGRVHPAGGDRWSVPSTIEDPIPHDYTGTPQCRVLYPNNMVCPRTGVLAIGGFDTRFGPAAEDNDLCYRWLQGGNRLLYEPVLRVWHHDWRSPAELRDVYRSYGRGQGAFYAKHLRQGDGRMLRFLAEDLYGAVRATAAATVGRQPQRARAPLGLLRGLPGGLLRGWREFGPAP